MDKGTSLRVACLTVLLVGQVGARASSAQTPPASGEAKRFVGTWRLVSETQTGIMIYDSLPEAVGHKPSIPLPKE